MGSSATKANLVEFQGKRSFSRKSKCGNEKHTGLDLFRKCLCQERAGTMYTKNSMAMLVNQQGRKPGTHGSRSVQDKE